MDTGDETASLRAAVRCGSRLTASSASEPANEHTDTDESLASEDEPPTLTGAVDSLAAQAAVADAEFTCAAPHSTIGPTPLDVMAVAAASAEAGSGGAYPIPEPRTVANVRKWPRQSGATDPEAMTGAYLKTLPHPIS